LLGNQWNPLIFFRKSKNLNGFRYKTKENLRKNTISIGKSPKSLYYSNKTNKNQKHTKKVLYCSKKTQKTRFWRSRPAGAAAGQSSSWPTQAQPAGISRTLLFCFFGTVQHFFGFILVFIGFIGTVQ